MQDEVRGWVFEGNVVRLLRWVSRYIGYAYDDLDEVALTAALRETDDEADVWFSYPLAGDPPLTAWLALAPGSAVAMVRITGRIDQVLAARIDTVIDLLSE